MKQDPQRKLSVKLTAARARVERATVVVAEPEKHGQGVIVPSKLIVTAAHCVAWDEAERCRVEGQWGDPICVRVTVGGAPVFAQVYAVEPIADVAVLGALDNERFTEECEAYEQAIDAIAPAPVGEIESEFETWTPVYIYTHDKGWVDAEVIRGDVRPDGLALRLGTQRVKSGTSGGPIVARNGKVIGVVSIVSGSGGGEGEGSAPHLAWTVPRWLWERMLDPRWEERHRRAWLRRHAKELAARRRDALGLLRSGKIVVEAEERG